MKPISDELYELVRVSVPLGVRVGAECARFVLPIFERAHPTDDRPRKAIIAAERWARNPTSKNKNAMGDANRAATVCLRAAYDRAYSQPVNMDAEAEAVYAIAYAANAAGVVSNPTTLDLASDAVMRAVSAVRAVSVAITPDDDLAAATRATAVVRQHLVDTDWWIKYDWTEVIRRPTLRLMVPQFPYTRGPLRLWIGGVESCWTLPELQQRRRSTVVDVLLVAIDAAAEGRYLTTT